VSDRASGSRVRGADPFGRLSAGERALLRPAPLPLTVEPMKAVLTAERFSDPAWIFERKLDGIRCIAIKDGRGVRLLSRNNLAMNARFPEIARALAAHGAMQLVMDGEIVAFAGGRTSFELLQQRSERHVEILLYAFDLLHLAGYDTTTLPLHARRRLLRGAADFKPPLRLTPSRKRDGERLYAEACRRGWEGLIAKRHDAPYTHGRSSDWLKFKCTAEQEFVIGGHTAPRGSRSDLGALLLGYFENGRLRYAGKVGTGFTRAALAELSALLAPLRRETSPFADIVREPHTTWVEPRLVAQVGFSEWTRDGRLRHSTFLGLRDDKPAGEVARET
jgi:bifunctional non-homologous end joining protein LigD